MGPSTLTSASFRNINDLNFLDTSTPSDVARAPRTSQATVKRLAGTPAEGPWAYWIEHPAGSLVRPHKHFVDHIEYVLEGALEWFEDESARNWRNGEPVARLDVDEKMKLVAEYGPDGYRQHEDQIRHHLSRPEPHPTELDDWSACGIHSSAELVELFTDRFYFGCEADDPLNALAFDTRLLPHGVSLSADRGSDIGHWDVPDLDEVLLEAHELVDRGQFSADNFADFVYRNPVRLYGRGNPDFFKGTQVQKAAADLLAADG